MFLQLPSWRGPPLVAGKRPQTHSWSPRLTDPGQRSRPGQLVQKDKRYLLTTGRGTQGQGAGVLTEPQRWMRQCQHHLAQPPGHAGDSKL